MPFTFIPRKKSLREGSGMWSRFTLRPCFVFPYSKILQLTRCSVQSSETSVRAIHSLLLSFCLSRIPPPPRAPPAFSLCTTFLYWCYKAVTSQHSQSDSGTLPPATMLFKCTACAGQMRTTCSFGTSTPSLPPKSTTPKFAPQHAPAKQSKAPIHKAVRP